jgi:hypothetical protein
MKLLRSTIIPVSLLLLPFISIGQNKKDTKIIVTVTDTTNLFNRLALAFIEKGYTLEQKDKELGFIATGEKTHPKMAASKKLRAQIIKGTIIFTGLVALDSQIAGLARTFDPLQYRGAKGSVFMDAWEEMKGIASQFGTLAYSK